MELDEIDIKSAAAAGSIKLTIYRWMLEEIQLLSYLSVSARSTGTLVATRVSSKPTGTLFPQQT